MVSSDGHPISGIIPFTVGDAAPIVRESAPATSGRGSLCSASCHKASSLEKLRSRYLPLLFLKATEPGAGGSSWHVCQGHTCLKPFQEMEAALSSLPQQPNFPDFTS